MLTIRMLHCILIIFLLAPSSINAQPPDIEGWMDAVSVVEVDYNNSVRVAGTGFVAFHREEETTFSFITNKHVIAGNDHVYIRINKDPQRDTAGTRDYMRLRVDFAPPGAIVTYNSHYYSSDSSHITVSLYQHPNDSIDVACFLLPEWRIIARHVNAIKLSPGIHKNINLGDPALLITYILPGHDSLVGRRSNKPIIRSGVVSSTQNDPLPYDNNGKTRFWKDTILIDALIFGGNSGSPLFINTYYPSDNGTMVFARSLIGIIVGNVPIATFLEKKVQQDQYLPYSKQNYGIAIAHMSDKIIETIKMIPKPSTSKQ